MKCYTHNEREAVCACTVCGNFICEGCRINIDGNNVCKSCIENGFYKPNIQRTQSYTKPTANNGQGKSWLATLLLCLFTGTLGIHRFYVGKVGTGILQLITGGGFGIWTLVDFILIACKKFTDKNGNLIID